MRLLFTLPSVMLAIVLFCHLEIYAQTPVELGKVHWGRDLDAAKKKSAATGKPIFVQFQEVPG